MTAGITLRELSAARDRGLIPEGPLIVSTGHVIVSTAHVSRIVTKQRVTPLRIDSRDVRALVGLQIVIAHDGREVDKIVDLVDLIVRGAPQELDCWDTVTNRWVSVISFGIRRLAAVPPPWGHA